MSAMESESVVGPEWSQATPTLQVLSSLQALYGEQGPESSMGRDNSERNVHLIQAAMGIGSVTVGSEHGPEVKNVEKTSAQT